MSETNGHGRRRKPKRWRHKKPTPCAYRLLVPADVADSIMPMLEQWRLEHMAEPRAVRYPELGPETVEEAAVELATDIAQDPRCVHIGAVVGYTRGPNGEVHGGKVKGFLIGRVIRRPVGTPKHVAIATMLYVDRSFRARRIAPRMIFLLTRVLRERYQVEQLEAVWTPGTHAERLWQRAGFIGYQVLGAYVDANGATRSDIPFDRAGRRAARWAVS